MTTGRRGHGQVNRLAWIVQSGGSMECGVVFERFGFRVWRSEDGPHLRHDFEVLDSDGQQPRSRPLDDHEKEQLLALLEAAPPSRPITQAIHALRFEMGLPPQARW